MNRYRLLLLICLMTGFQVASQAQGQGAPAAKAPMTNDAKIKSALSAAPAGIAKDAAVMAPGAAAGAPMVELKKGTNGWTCMPGTPSSQGVTTVDDTAPMCLDREWMSFIDAWMKKTTPKVSAPGVGYMLKGDKGNSNKDPYATAPTADNDWVVSGPHVMFMEPDVKKLEALSSDHRTGGPYVMWKGTPYAHIMVPLGGGMMGHPM